VALFSVLISSLDAQLPRYDRRRERPDFIFVSPLVGIAANCRAKYQDA
jgi:hypothetical protein